MIRLGAGTMQDEGRILEALSRSLAIIEFDPTGTILGANANFCAAVGYAEDEIKGRHHRMFVEPELAGAAEYRAFWTRLAAGEFESREFKRIGKGGREVWIQASYNPVKNSRGVTTKVIKVASDITAQKQQSLDHEGKITAISRSQAVIEFTPTGEILTANQNFLDTLGYRLEELRGQHHRMFVDPAETGTAAYRDFWARLSRGDYVDAEFRRIGKNGKDVWIQASYNPVLTESGKVIKVVKFATDVTARVEAVKEIGAGLKRMSENDLDRKIDFAFPLGLEPMRHDFNAAVDTVRETLAQMADRTRAIKSNANELSASADDLSRRTEQQAASLEQTAAALDEITATVRKSADGADLARRTVAGADADAKKSTEIVKQAVNAMDAISSSSNQIGQIIGVIDEIAFQTNLLALNAGVEAARAGDAGRGFAVVASEVRALAQRSADAAKEIKGLISSSSSQVQGGVKLVAETGIALERIMTQVSTINASVAEIASGAREQAIALGEINAAINQMDQATQQNAAMVEETTAATHALNEATDQLVALISRQERQTTPGQSSPARRPSPARAPVAQVVSHPRKAASGGGGDSWTEF